jgi:hypothetical protein
MTRLWINAIRIDVETDAAGCPVRFTWRGEAHPIVRVVNTWRVDTEWWTFRIWREHFKVATETGYLLILYHDLLDDGWYLQRLYD